MLCQLEHALPYTYKYKAQDVPVHTCALGYLWLCKPCFYGQPGNLWPRCQAQADAPSATQQCSDSQLITTWCLLCAWRCYCLCLGRRDASARPCTLVSPYFSPLFLHFFRNNQQQNLQLYILCALAAIWTVGIVLAVGSRCSGYDVDSHQLSKSAAEITMTVSMSF